MATIHLCKDDRGYLYGVVLPDNVASCANGPVLGPPDGLDKIVHNLLAEAHIFNAFDLLNNRPALFNVLRDANYPKEYARTVTNLYQRQYFKEEN